jgi:hypothetical protein
MVRVAREAIRPILMKVFMIEIWMQRRQYEVKVVKLD